MAGEESGVTRHLLSTRSDELTSLSRDHDHVALKIYTREGNNRDELQACDTLSKGNPSHPGYGWFRTVLDLFTLMGTEGWNHHCLVQKPMWDSWRDLLCRNSAHRFRVELLKPSLKYLSLALDYLRSECKLVHTGTRGESHTVLLF